MHIITNSIYSHFIRYLLVRSVLIKVKSVLQVTAWCSVLHNVEPAAGDGWRCVPAAASLEATVTLELRRRTGAGRRQAAASGCGAEVVFLAAGAGDW